MSVSELVSSYRFLFRTYSTVPALFYCTALLFFSCNTALRPGYNPAEKLPPAKLKEDAVLLRNILEANHPSLYWYTPKDSMDYYFNKTINGITDSLTELQFRNKIAALVAKIRCGHTSVRASKDYARFYNIHKRPQFPLAIKAWGDTLVVIANAIKTDTVFKRGTIVTSINGLSNKAILDSIFQIISTDGYSDNFKYQLVSFNFPAFYNIVFGRRDSNVITYTDASGIEKKGALQNLMPGLDTGGRHPLNTIAFPKLTRKQIKAARNANTTSLTFDSTNTAYMRLTTFSGPGLRRFFRKSFNTIQQKHAASLVIDLRENGGGNIGVSANLTRYIIQRPFTLADTVSAVSRKFLYHQYINQAGLYKAMMLFTSKKEKDGRYHFGYLEHHVYHPKTRLHFNGNVYIIQSGFTFSAASMFISHVKGQQNVTVTGEESGGGNYGNSSVFLPTVILPNTRIEISMPVYRIVNNAQFLKNGRGIMPDVFIGPSANAIKNGIDIKMQKVRKLIQARTGTGR